MKRISVANVWNNPDTEIKHCLLISGAAFCETLACLRDRKDSTSNGVVFISSCEPLSHFRLIAFITDIVLIKQPSVEGHLHGLGAEW